MFIESQNKLKFNGFDIGCPKNIQEFESHEVIKNIQYLFSRANDFFFRFFHSLAAISTLYFVEHGKQIERHYLRRYEGNDFFSDRNYLANSSSYESNAMVGGEGFSGRHNNSVDLAHSPKKVINAFSSLRSFKLSPKLKRSNFLRIGFIEDNTTKYSK